MIDEGVQIYVSESLELLEDMEAALLELEQDPNDADVLNRLFRAVHTIKGSAGLFGFEKIIGFTHVVENVLDDVRNCLIPITPDLITLMMGCRDHISSLIDNINGDNVVDESEGAHLIELLESYKPGNVSPSVANHDSEEPVTADSDNSDASGIGAGEGVQSDSFHISVRLGEDTFRGGFDPASMFRNLRGLGTIESAQLVESSIPLLSELDAENCHLGWEISLKSSADKQTIASVFEFIEGASAHILPPKSSVEDFQKLINFLPEDDTALGQILVQIGTLTGQELQEALNTQRETGGKTGEILVEQKSVQPEVVQKALSKQENTRNAKQRETSYVRVDADKLDKLVNLVGELVISGAKVSQLAYSLDNEDLIESVEEMTAALEEMRETGLGLRMVPIGGTFNRFHRVVRDTSKALDKKITLEIYGGETELDKTVVDNIGDPLMHLVRNSMDHGIESPRDRLAVGKPEAGTIKLTAYHETGTIVIEISDDGRGLDPDKILTKARERGLVKPNQNLSENEIYRLIFEPGFSTAETVSDISGRGVGMDVVRRNIEKLRGSVDIESSLGQGTRIIIRLPLTLAIIDGFHVSVVDGSHIIPLDMVVECVTLNDEQRIEAQQHDYICLREEVLPLLNLEAYFNIDKPSATQSVTANTRQNLVVVRFANNKAGLLVDTLHGEVQAVIKPLGRVFHGLNGFSGFTILGSGQVAMILDVPGLIQGAGRRDVEIHAALATSQRGNKNSVLTLH